MSPTTMTPVTDSIVRELCAICGAANVIYGDPPRLSRYSRDQVPEKHSHVPPEVVAMPGSTAEVQAIIRLANREHAARHAARGGKRALRRGHPRARRDLPFHGTDEQDPRGGHGEPRRRGGTGGGDEQARRDAQAARPVLCRLPHERGDLHAGRKRRTQRGRGKGQSSTA